jgi:hypothetical protein
MRCSVIATYVSGGRCASQAAGPLSSTGGAAGAQPSRRAPLAAWLGVSCSSCDTSQEIRSPLSMRSSARCAPALPDRLGVLSVSRLSALQASTVGRRTIHRPAAGADEEQEAVQPLVRIPSVRRAVRRQEIELACRQVRYTGGSWSGPWRPWLTMQELPSGTQRRESR